MSKILNPRRTAPTPVRRRASQLRELDANELASVVGGVTRPPPQQGGASASQSEGRRDSETGGFWSWLFG
jgi:hypothetical protein